MAKTIYKLIEWIKPEDKEKINEGEMNFFEAEDKYVKIIEVDDEHISLKKIRELIGNDCRMTDRLPGTGETIWVDDEGILKDEEGIMLNPIATQEWQDSASYHMGWEWLNNHYGGFVWYHSVAVGNAVQIVQGVWDIDDEDYENGENKYIYNSINVSKEEYENAIAEE